MSRCLRAFLLCSCAFFCLAAACAQPAGLEEKKGLVQGQVLNAITGEPIRRATVVLNRIGVAQGGGGMGMAVSIGPGGMGGAGGGLSATTDAAGNFSIPGVDPGSYIVSAQKTGFLRVFSNVAGRRGISPIKVSAGQEIKDVQVKLTPQAVLTGRVLDEEGEPVQGVMLQVLTQRYFRGRRQMMPMSSGQSNDRGEYRLANLSPGKYVVSAAANRMLSFGGNVRPADGSPEMGYATMYYPGVQDAAQATRLDVAAGVELGGLDFRLQKTRVYRVRGRVLDTNGAPMKNIYVSLNPRNSAGMFMTSGSGTRPNDGSFDIGNVIPGSYVLMARAMESGQQASIQHPIDVGDGNIEGIVLTPVRGQSIEGTVVVEGGETVPLQGVRIVLSPADVSPMSTPTAAAKGDGSFTLPNVLPGRYEVTVFATTESAYVSSVKLGGQEVLGQEADLSGGVPARMQVTLSTGPGQITGVASAGDGPGVGATVVLVPEGARAGQNQFFRNTTADPSGAFTFRGIAPGDYKVFAWEEVEMGAWQDPEFRRPVENEGVAVKVSARAKETIRVKVIPSAK